MLSRLAVAAASLAFLTQCTSEVPPDKLEYVGHWQAPQMRLLITHDGSISYDKKDDSSSLSVKLSLRSFSSTGFTAGFGPFTTNFEVERPPRHDGTRWTMSVDGVELSKVEDGRF